MNRWLIRSSLARATLVTVGSPLLQRLAATHVPPSRTRLSPLGVNPTRFQRVGDRDDHVTLAGRPVLLHVASLSAVKDQPTLFEAFARARRDLPGAHLHIVGDGEARASLGRLAQTLGLDPHVTFHGAVPHHRLPRYYRAADLCVLSSRFESQGMVVLEAAFCGRRTIGTRVGLLPEIAGTDAAVPAADPQALATLMVSTWVRRVELPLPPSLAHDQLSSLYGLGPTVARLCALYGSL